jgi:hypothetical protein
LEPLRSGEGGQLLPGDCHPLTELLGQALLDRGGLRDADALSDDRPAGGLVR